jgi:parallel beta-helix repeat protein
MNPSFGSGIYFENQVGIPLVRNNTIYDNFTYGIECSQDGADPNISNCIISGNDTNDLYRFDGSFNKVHYCLLQNPLGDDNLTGSPGFMNITTDPNDLHIAENSQCKDAGDPNGSYEGEFDIDGESRVAYERVDIGADEYYWSKADYDKDGLVNFIDFATFASAWRTNDANISLDEDIDVDMDDLKLFCDEWLWEFGGGGSQWLAMAGGDGGGFSPAGEIQTNEIAEEAASGLMLPDVRSSMDSRPARLRSRTDKFYSIKAPVVISAFIDAAVSNEIVSYEEPAASQPAIVEQPISDEQIQVLIDWAEQIWQDDPELQEMIDPNDYQRFIDSLKEQLND